MINNIPQYNRKANFPKEKSIKKNASKNPEIEALKEQLKGSTLPEVNIPNSHSAKISDLIDATASLIYAKSLNRPVRRAKSCECQAYLEYKEREKRKPVQLIGIYEAAKILKADVKTFREIRDRNKIKPEKIVQQRDFYNKEQIESLLLSEKL